MDVTLFPPTSILANHSHHIYHHPTPPASDHRAMSQDFKFGLGSSSIGTPHSSQSTSTHQRTTTMTYLRSPLLPAQIPTRRHPIPHSSVYISCPPSDGSSPFLNLPEELLLHILSYLPFETLLRLRRTSTQLTSLAMHPSLHRSLSLFALPPNPLPPLLTRHILPSVRHLHLHLFPLPTPCSAATSPSEGRRADEPTQRVIALLDLITADQLISLSLPFSAPLLPSADLGEILNRIGGKLEKLDLRGSAVEGVEYLEWMSEMVIRNNYGGLKELDLGFTSISAPPLSLISTDDSSFSHNIRESTCWASLRKLSLASCSSLSAGALATFLAVLPANIESLDLSRLEQVSFTALKEMRVIVDHPESEPTRLREIKLVGIDHLTRSNIRTLKKHWQNQRLSVLDPTPPAFSWNTLTQPTQRRRVWGEPRTPEPLPLPPASLPRLIPTPQHIGDSLSAGSWSSSRTPSLISRSSSSATSDSSIPSSADDRTSFSRPSALASHAALWSALSADAEQGMNASPGVWRSRLPEHPYLPSRSAPTACLNPSSLWSGETNYLRQTVDHPQTKEVGINVTHSAILESEDEEGYRMFIGEVAGASTVPVTNGGLSLGMGSGVGAELSGLGIGLFGGMGGWGGGAELMGGYMREGEEYLDDLAGF